MSKDTNIYLKQAKLKGKIAVSSLGKEGYTSTMYVDIYDADTGASRTLSTTGPYLITIDPKGKKKQGIEFCVAATASQSSSRITFSNVKRGLSKDDWDDAGGYTNALAWAVGTEVGFTTDHFNTEFLRDILGGNRDVPTGVKHAGTQSFKGQLGFLYTPAFLTCGSSPTTAVATWEAVTDGAFQLTIDGTARSITALDFTNVGSLDQVASVIQAGIRTVTSGLEEVEWNGTAFLIKSGATTSSSAMTVLTAGASGTDISGAGATAFLDGDTGHGTVTAKNKGFIISGTVADATEMNALTGVANGAEIYVTGEGVKYDYLAGSWVAREAGGTFPNASTTVAGKVEEATTAEMGAGTAAGATGARLFVNSGNLVKTSSGAGDENKIPVLGGAGSLAVGFMPTNVQEANTFFGATDITGAEAETLTDGSDASTKHVHDMVTNLRLDGRMMVIDGWDSATATLGTVSKGTYLSLQTNASNGATGYVYTLPYPLNTSLHDKNPKWMCWVYGPSSVCDSIWGFWDNTLTFPANGALTADHAAFIADDNVLYASVADGSTQTKSATVGAANAQAFYCIEYSGGHYLFYINNVLVWTSTANEPNSVLNYTGVGTITRENVAKVIYCGHGITTFDI
jgi:hypothetical protein